MWGRGGAGAWFSSGGRHSVDSQEAVLVVLVPVLEEGGMEMEPRAERRVERRLVVSEAGEEELVVTLLFLLLVPVLLLLLLLPVLLLELLLLLLLLLSILLAIVAFVVPAIWQLLGGDGERSS